MANYGDLPLMEITLRKYEQPHNLNLRDTIKKICLSIGLLQPGDSRDIIVDILMVLEKAKKETVLLNTEEIKERVIKLRREKGLSDKGTAMSNIRRQLKRLRDKLLVEKINNNYRIYENLPLEIIFEKNIKKFIIEYTLETITNYFKYYEEKFGNNK